MLSIFDLGVRVKDYVEIIYLARIDGYARQPLVRTSHPIYCFKCISNGSIFFKCQQDQMTSKNEKATKRALDCVTTTPQVAFIGHKGAPASTRRTELTVFLRRLGNPTVMVCDAFPVEGVGFGRGRLHGAVGNRTYRRDGL